MRPDLPLWVTMFDRTVSRELEHVTSKSTCSRLALAGEEIIGRRHGVRVVDDALRLLVAAGTGL